jgi:hypothetical protein
MHSRLAVVGVLDNQAAITYSAQGGRPRRTKIFQFKNLDDVNKPIAAAPNRTQTSPLIVAAVGMMIGLVPVSRPSITTPPSTQNQ